MVSSPRSPFLCQSLRSDRTLRKHTFLQMFSVAEKGQYSDRRWSPKRKEACVATLMAVMACKKTQLEREVQEASHPDDKNKAWEMVAMAACADREGCVRRPRCLTESRIWNGVHRRRGNECAPVAKKMQGRSALAVVANSAKIKHTGENQSGNKTKIQQQPPRRSRPTQRFGTGKGRYPTAERDGHVRRNLHTHTLDTAAPHECLDGRDVTECQQRDTANGCRYRRVQMEI